MKWKEGADRLRQLINRPKSADLDWTIFVPEAPVPMTGLIRDLVESEEEEWELDDCGDAGFVLDNSDLCPWESTDHIGFHFYSGGPCVLTPYLGSFTADGRLYVTYHDDWSAESLFAIAAIESDRSDLFDNFFLELLRSNGVDYNIELFGSLPTETYCGTVSKDIVKAGYTQWMEWGEQQDEDVWTPLIQMVSASSLLEYAQSFVKLLGEFESAEDLNEYLKWREGLGKKLSCSEKSRILETYFQQALK